MRARTAWKEQAVGMAPGGRRTAVGRKGQVGTVLADLPRFVTPPLLRRWHRRWGTTADEVHAPVAGDDALPGAHYRATPAITIGAPPEAVWPWIVRAGCLRAGWYSNDLPGQPRPPERTRLATRVRAVHDRRRPLAAAAAVLLMEVGAFAMMRRMLLRIRDRAEAQWRRDTPDAPVRATPRVGAAR
jgi:hypothetical protein